MHAWVAVGVDGAHCGVRKCGDSPSKRNQRPVCQQEPAGSADDVLAAALAWTCP